MGLFAIGEREEDLTHNIEGQPFVHIEATNSTPEIILNKEQGTFLFKGRSLPENPRVFYQPVKNWITDYMEKPADFTHIKFDTHYFNTASSKVFLDIISMFREMEIQGQKLSLEWHYQEDDEDTLEAGEDMAEILEMKFQFIPYVD
ncbi:MAG: DUF1987 domain-containing protein [Bacteroidota bacterium]